MLKTCVPLSQAHHQCTTCRSWPARSTATSSLCLPTLTHYLPIIAPPPPVHDIVLYRYIVSEDSVEGKLAARPMSTSYWSRRDPRLAPLGICTHPRKSYICAVLNSSIRHSTLPSVGMSVNSVPIPKKSPPQDIDKDLQPISLAPTLSKVLELYVCTWVNDCTMHYIDSNIKSTSTTHAFIALLHQPHRELDKPGTEACVPLIDFPKAFDHSNHAHGEA